MDSSDSSSEEKNFQSEKFDAKKILQSISVKLPVQDAKVFNNLDEYANKSFPKSQIEKGQDPVIKEQDRIRKQMFEMIKPVEKTKKWAPPKTILTLMNNQTDLSGYLKSYLSKRINIFIRRRKKCNHFCEQFTNLFGQLLFFDKHWNLVLKDVKENVKVLNNLNLLDKETKLDKSNEFSIRERYFTLLFVRGDNIIYISSIKENLNLS